jgi:hypothetical protein
MSYEVSAGEWAHPHIGRLSQPAYSATRREAGTGAPDTRPPDMAPGARDDDAAAEGELTFWDFLDLVNPLQHIPVVSSIYRELTGDEIAAPMRTLGGFLFTGPLGFINGALNGIVEEASGRDIGENFFALFDGGEASIAAAPSTDKEAPATSIQAAAPLADPPPNEPPRPVVRSIPTQETRPDGLAAPGGEAPAQGALNGTPALRAFLSDLRMAGEGVRTTAAPSTVAQSASPAVASPIASARPGRFYPLPRETAGAAVNIRASGPAAPRPGPPPARAELPQLPPTAARPPASLTAAAPTADPPAADPSVAERMLQALEKYETMAQRRKAAKQGG